MANNAENQTLLSRLRTLGPESFAERVMASVDSLIQLPWQSFEKGPALPSKPDGNPFDVHFINQREVTVELFWMDRNGTPKSYGKIDAGQRQKQQTRPGGVWMIADSITGKQLGHFVVDDRTARAIIPPTDN